MMLTTTAALTQDSGASTSNQAPIAEPMTTRTRTTTDLRQGTLRRYAKSLTRLLAASSSAARATPSLVPRVRASRGTSTREPPSPAEADSVQAAAVPATISRRISGVMAPG
jgi:hypothetical protein